jgi:hypothetical protein
VALRNKKCSQIDKRVQDVHAWHDPWGGKTNNFKCGSTELRQVTTENSHCATSPSHRKKSYNWCKGTLDIISTTATMVRFRSWCVHQLVTGHRKRCDCLAQSRFPLKAERNQIWGLHVLEPLTTWLIPKGEVYLVAYAAWCGCKRKFCVWSSSQPQKLSDIREHDNFEGLIGIDVDRKL